MSENGKHKFHVYRRVKHPKRRDLWYCVSPECNHRVNQMYLPDKKAECPHCGDIFTITARKLRDQSFLHCDNCKKGAQRDKPVPTLDDIANKLKEIL